MSYLDISQEHVSSTLLCFFRYFPLSPGMAFGGFHALGVSSDDILNNFIL